jgi:hypothetical protein
MTCTNVTGKVQQTEKAHNHDCSYWIEVESSAALHNDMQWMAIKVLLPHDMDWCLWKGVTKRKITIMVFANRLILDQLEHSKIIPT